MGTVTLTEAVQTGDLIWPPGEYRDDDLGPWAAAVRRAARSLSADRGRMAEASAAAAAPAAGEEVKHNA